MRHLPQAEAVHRIVARLESAENRKRDEAMNARTKFGIEKKVKFFRLPSLHHYEKYDIIYGVDREQVKSPLRGQKKGKGNEDFEED